jgi:hypothetical protein
VGASGADGDVEEITGVLRQAWPYERAAAGFPPVPTMSASEKLLAFFRSEFEAEERSGFARLKRVPDTHVQTTLRYFFSLPPEDRAAFIDCSAHWAHSQFGFVSKINSEQSGMLSLEGVESALRASQLDHTKHPFFPRWLITNIPLRFRTHPGIPIFRTVVAQYKIDKQRGVPSGLSEELFRFAESVKSIKAPELRKRVRGALKDVGYHKKDELGFYCCNWGGQEFKVDVDFGGRNAQLRYSVLPPELKNVPLFVQLCFERALGMGLGDWDFITEENVDDVFLLFQDLVKYAVNLPRRIKEAV